MDADSLRIALIAAGLLLVLGIYLWDRYKRAQRNRARARRRHPSEVATGGDGVTTPSDEWEITVRNPDERDGPAMSFSDEALPDESPSDGAWSEEPRLDESEPMDAPAFAQAHDTVPHMRAAQDEETDSEDLEVLEDMLKPAPREDFRAPSFSARDPYLDFEAGLGKVAPKILQINIAARGGWFNGGAIAQSATEVELQPGEMNIYHRMDEASGKALFSMASMVNPGSFPFDDMSGFETPGLTLFAQLPGPRDGLAIYSDMLFTAERVAATLDGELQDETHSALTRQTIEHTRESILEHRRQLQLASKKA